MVAILSVRNSEPNRNDVEKGWLGKRLATSMEIVGDTKIDFVDTDGHGIRIQQEPVGPAIVIGARGDYGFAAAIVRKPIKREFHVSGRPTVHGVEDMGG